MERSKSCTNFETTANGSNNNNNNNNTTSSNNNSNSNTNASTFNLRKALELRQTQLQQQQQQQQQQQHLPLFDPPLRKKMLQRQKTTVEYLDDNVLATPRSGLAEEEEDEEYDEEEDYDAHERKYAREHEVLALLPYQKHLLFKNHKPNSESSLHLNDSACVLNHHNNSSSTNTSTSSSSVDHRLKHGESFDSATEMSPVSRRHNFGQLGRDNSVHSDSSRYSSVDSLLEARKPDPEAILINLGFGPVDSEDILSRIPKRFLKPSQVRGIDTEAFVKRLQLASNLADHSVLGYRGLTGNPDVPPSSIVAKIMQRFEVNERKKSMGSAEHTIR